MTPQQFLLEAIAALSRAGIPVPPPGEHYGQALAAAERLMRILGATPHQEPQRALPPSPHARPQPPAEAQPNWALPTMALPNVRDGVR